MRLISVALALMSISLLEPRSGYGQALAGFDAASVKPAPPERLRVTEDTKCENGWFHSGGFPVSFAIRWSYQIGDAQILNLPDWARDWNSAYDFEARSATAVSQEQCRLMVQSLLADRFRLTAHRETRQTRGYALMVSEHGPKMEEVTGSGAGKVARINGQAVVDAADSNGLSMAGLARYLTAHPAVGFPVIDKTGLAGKYSFNLIFSRWRYAPDSVSEDPEDRPSILTAIKALGLKLESTQVPVDALVVDRIEKPGANR